MSIDSYKFVNQTPYDATPYGLGEEGLIDAAKEKDSDPFEDDGCGCRFRFYDSGKMEQINECTYHENEGHPKKSNRALLPSGSYSDLTLEPPNGPECCKEVKRVDCVCASAWRCPQHGEWHFGVHD